MRIVKRMISMILAATLVIGLSACSNSSKSNSNSGTKGDANSTADSGTNTAAPADKTYDKIVYAYLSFNNIPEDVSEVEAAINQITREKIGVEVTLKPYSIADYTQQINLALQSGEQIDVFHSLGDFNQSVTSQQAYDITDIIDSSAAETKALVGDAWLEATSREGRIYGIPAYKPIALTPMLIYRQDIADKLGIDMTKVKSINDVTDVFRKVKEGKPDMTPFAPVSPGTTGVLYTLPEVDNLTDSYVSPKGVLMHGNTNVIDLYASDEFANVCNIVRTWYNEGLIMQDAATTTSAAADLMSSGNYFSYMAAYSYPPEDTATSLEGQTGGNDLGAVQLGDAYLDTTTVNAITWMVSSTCKKPEAALKFLNLTYTDPDVVNLIIYGIEGKDYVKNADGSVKYPDGMDAATVPYTAQLSCGIVGNFFIQYPFIASNPESLKWEENQNKNAKMSVAMGFTFDNSNVKTEYTAVESVISQYLPALQCGSVDPAVELPNFIEALKSAGMNSIIAEKQKQLDAWLATK
ncbi:MAG TPA: ABC transporter substrate-binding protein [Mobilitalea sp.]|nr:ABC transporter substrate-binding protein [Mobilitalea sp.]